MKKNDWVSFNPNTFVGKLALGRLGYLMISFDWNIDNDIFFAWCLQLIKKTVMDLKFKSAF